MMKIKYMPITSNWNAALPINLTKILSCNVPNCDNKKSYSDESGTFCKYFMLKKLFSSIY